MRILKRSLQGSGPCSGKLLLAAILLACSGTFLPASSLELGKEEIRISADSTYVTKYIWHGYDQLRDHGAWQPSLTVGWRGLSLGIWGSWASEGGFTNADELDYFVGYSRSLFQGKPYGLDFSLTYTYLDYPKSDSASGRDGVADSQELALGLSLPTLLPLGPSFLVPSYVGYYEWDGIQGRRDLDNGWIHTFGLSYSLPVPLPPAIRAAFSVDLGWDVSYNDGTFGSRPGLSHTAAHLSLGWSWNGFSFTPGLHYQWSLEETVNPEDELYGTFSLGWRF